MSKSDVDKYVERTRKWMESPVGIGRLYEWDKLKFSERKKLEYAVMFSCVDKSFRGTTLKLIADALEESIDARPYNGD